MTEKLYYWAENLENYSSDNEQDYDQVIEIKRLNFFIGKNNAGKSRFLRNLFFTENRSKLYRPYISQSDIAIAEAPLTKISENINQYRISFNNSNDQIKNFDQYINYLKKVTRDVCFLVINVEKSLTDLNSIPALFAAKEHQYSISGKYFFNEILNKFKNHNIKEISYIFSHFFYIPTRLCCTNLSVKAFSAI